MSAIKENEIASCIRKAISSYLIDLDGEKPGQLYSMVINSVEVLNVMFSVNTQTSGTSAQLVDSFLTASYRGADYTITIKDNGANAFHAAKTLILHDGGTSYMTTYGVIYSNTSLGILAANANATHIRLYLTPTVTNTQVKGVRTMVVV